MSTADGWDKRINPRPFGTKTRRFAVPIYPFIPAIRCTHPWEARGLPLQPFHIFIHPRQILLRLLIRRVMCSLFGNSMSTADGWDKRINPRQFGTKTRRFAVPIYPFIPSIRCTLLLKPPLLPPSPVWRLRASFLIGFSGQTGVGWAKVDLPTSLAVVHLTWLGYINVDHLSWGCYLQFF